MKCHRGFGTSIPLILMAFTMVAWGIAEMSKKNNEIRHALYTRIPLVAGHIDRVANAGRDESELVGRGVVISMVQGAEYRLRALILQAALPRYDYDKLKLERTHPDRQEAKTQELVRAWLNDVQVKRSGDVSVGRWEEFSFSGSSVAWLFPEGENADAERAETIDRLRKTNPHVEIDVSQR